MTQVIVLQINTPSLLQEQRKTKIALFQYEGVIVESNSKNVNDWKWRTPSVPDTLRGYYEDGYRIVVITHQTEVWKQFQIETVLDQLKIPCIVGISFDPHISLETLFRETCGPLTITDAFYVATQSENLRNFRRVLPEGIFEPLHALRSTSELSSLSASSSVDRKVAKQEKRPNEVLHSPEVIVMVGYPGSGKTYFCQKEFATNSQYLLIQGEVYKTTARMIGIARRAVENRRSVIFDATNASKKRRAEYIRFAKEQSLPVRCIHIATSLEDSVVRNQQSEHIVSKMVFTTYRNQFESPEKTEGFDEIITIS